MAGQPVKVLVVDPDAGYHRVVETGEFPVNAEGTPLGGDIGIVLGIGNDADAQQIKNLADPTDDQDAATKVYVDAQIGANNDLDEILANGNDAMGQSIVGLCGIYFSTGCEGGESSSSSAGEEDTWIAPVNDLLVYVARAHDFQGSVTINGDVQIIGNAQFTITGTEKVYSAGTGLLTLTSATRTEILGKPLFVGAGSPEHSITGAGDCYIADRLEVADRLYVSGYTTLKGLVYVGVNDTEAGSVTLYGSSTGQDLGAQLYLYTSEDHHGTYDYYGILVNEDDLRFKQTTTVKLTLQGSDGTWLFGAAVGMGGYDITDVGSITMSGDLDMNCNDILFVQGIYFCDFGSSSSSGSSGFTDLWIRPDTDTGQQLEYHAEGGHRFESPVYFTGDVQIIGEAQFTVAGTEKIDSSGAGVLSLSSGTRTEILDKPLFVGTGVSAHNITAAGDLYVADDLEVADRLYVDGDAYFDETVFVGVLNDTQGFVTLYSEGTSSTYGGEIWFWLAEDYRATAGSVGIVAREDDIIFMYEDTTPKLTLQLAEDQWVFDATINMNCNDILFVDGLYFCNYGSSTSSGDTEPSELWIRPDRDTGQRLEYHAEGGSAFDGDVSAPSFSIGANILTTAEWGYLDGLDQSVGTTDLVTHDELTLSGGVLHVGVVDNEYGIVSVYGGSSGAIGGWLDLYVNAAHDDTIDRYDIRVYEDDLLFESSTSEPVRTTKLALLGEGTWLFSAAVAFAGDVDVVGHVETDDAYYLGDPDTNGSWRIVRDGWDLVFEQRDSGVWDECDRIAGCASSSSA